MDKRYIKRRPTCGKAGHVNPQKPLVRKNRDRVPPTKCRGANFGVLRLNYKNNSYDANYTIKINLMWKRQNINLCQYRLSQIAFIRHWKFP